MGKKLIINSKRNLKLNGLKCLPIMFQSSQRRRKMTEDEGRKQETDNDNEREHAPGGENVLFTV